jgi:hypothetical protein
MDGGVQCLARTGQQVMGRRAGTAVSPPCSGTCFCLPGGQRACAASCSASAPPPFVPLSLLATARANNTHTDKPACNWRDFSFHRPPGHRRQNAPSFFTPHAAGTQRQSETRIPMHRTEGTEDNGASAAPALLVVPSLPSAAERLFLEIICGHFCCCCFTLVCLRRIVWDRGPAAGMRLCSGAGA